MTSFYVIKQNIHCERKINHHTQTKLLAPKKKKNKRESKNLCINFFKGRENMTLKFKIYENEKNMNSGCEWDGHYLIHSTTHLGCGQL